MGALASSLNSSTSLRQLQLRKTWALGLGKKARERGEKYATPTVRLGIGEERSGGRDSRGRVVRKNEGTTSLSREGRQKKGRSARKQRVKNTRREERQILSDGSMTEAGRDSVLRTPVPRGTLLTGSFTLSQGRGKQAVREKKRTLGKKGGPVYGLEKRDRKIETVISTGRKWVYPAGERLIVVVKDKDY